MTHVPEIAEPRRPSSPAPERRHSRRREGDGREDVAVFDVDEVAMERWAARYNLAPTEDAPVIIRGPEGERSLRT